MSAHGQASIPYDHSRRRARLAADRASRAEAEHRLHLRRRCRLWRHLLLRRHARPHAESRPPRRRRRALHERARLVGHLHALALQPAHRRIRLAQEGHRRSPRRRQPDHPDRTARRSPGCSRSRAIAPPPSANGTSDWARGHVDWNAEIRPGPLEVGFDYSFIIPATGDRVPCVFVENHRVVNLDPKDPIRVNYDHPIGDEPTGKKNPEMLRMHPSHGHDMAIVNGVLAHRVHDRRQVGALGG